MMAATVSPSSPALAGGKKAGTLVVIIMKAVFSPRLVHTFFSVSSYSEEMDYYVHG
jgi:hypothetical protein